MEIYTISYNERINFETPTQIADRSLQMSKPSEVDRLMQDHSASKLDQVLGLALTIQKPTVQKTFLHLVHHLELPENSYDNKQYT